MYLAKRQILTVDDDPTTADLIRKAIDSFKIDGEVSRTSTGLEALGLMTKTRFDLCVLEYALPDMSGAELCTVLRRLHYALPVLFYTALDRSVDRSKALEAGADQFLTKSADINILADSIAHYIPRSADPVVDYRSHGQSSGLLKAA